MSTPAEKIKAILAPLDAYYAATPLEFSLGLQNFQSIRQYTKIPLAPITLIYGQNSAGKSAIHDAFTFIHDYLGGKAGAQQYLDRWACRNRTTRPLDKGFIGDPEDVVFSVKAWDADEFSYLDYHNKYQPASNPENLLCSDLWWADDREEPPRFELRFHFSHSEGKNWYISKFYLYLGNDVFFQYKSKGHDNLEDVRLSINRDHPVYLALGKLYGNSVDAMALTADGYIGKVESDNNWLHLKELLLSEEWISSGDLFFWADIDTGSDFTDLEYNPARSMRELLEAMLIIPSFIASRFLKLESVPPLRPVPTKNEACFRLPWNAHYSLTRDDKYYSWKQLAIDIRDNELYNLRKSLQLNKSKLKESDSARLIDYVNHALQHPLFLNTGYEVIGECQFLLSEKQIEEIRNHRSCALDAEVTLKLRTVPDNFPVDIEDVGVGISQIIPVLCAIHNSDATYIHQPELHLHPKHQSHLGDLFISKINHINNTSTDLTELTLLERSDLAAQTFAKQLIRYECTTGHFFIETHSEHILLRILRRIRETHRGDIKNKLFGFTADQLCVLYVDKDQNGDSQVIQLRVAENGEFIDRWPHGFFTERDEDLFDE